MAARAGRGRRTDPGAAQALRAVRAQSTAAPLLKTFKIYRWVRAGPAAIGQEYT